MLKLSNASFLISALLAGAAFTQTASATVVIDQPLAREASDGVRGEGGKKAGHPAIEVKDQLARRGADDAGGRGRTSEGAGHPAIEVKDQLARRGADDRGPDDRGGRGRRGGEGTAHPAIEVIDQLV